MTEATQKAIRKVAENAAVRVNSLYASAYMDVHSNAGPWGVKHDADVTAVIEEELSKLFMEMRLGKRT